MSPTIIVITGEANWTRRAVHLAAALAREESDRGEAAAIVIVRMDQVDHLEYLGAGEREVILSFEEFDALAEYLEITRSYGISASVATFEYSDYVGGVVAAADLWSAATVFAPVPSSAVGLLAAWRLWAMRWTLRRSGRSIYTLGANDEPDVQLVIPPELAVPVSAPRFSVRHP